MDRPAQNPRARLLAAVGAGAAALLLVLVPRYEGTVPKTYRDLGGILTACTGHTGPELKLGQTFTPAECEELLSADLVKHSHGMQDCVDVPMTDGEVAAYTSFAFNVGVRAFCNSTMAHRLNMGDHPGACAELSRWNKVGSRVLPGLVARRAAERKLCEGRA